MCDVLRSSTNIVDLAPLSLAATLPRYSPTRFVLIKIGGLLKSKQNTDQPNNFRSTGRSSRISLPHSTLVSLFPILRRAPSLFIFSPSHLNHTRSRQISCYQPSHLSFVFSIRRLSLAGALKPIHHAHLNYCSVTCSR